jgi:GT2 family glycosyltransferase/glycosyltransferase involved in cell wall biosynthesis
MDLPVSTGASSSNVKLAFASCSRDRIDPFVEAVFRMADPAMPLYVVAEFKPSIPCHWIPWQPLEDLATNRARILWRLGPHAIRYSAIILEPDQPYGAMRRLALSLAPTRTFCFNTNYGHFALHPRDLSGILRHAKWRLSSILRTQFSPGGKLYTILWRCLHPHAWRRPLLYRLARRRQPRPTAPPASLPIPTTLTPGITVVVPSRNGRPLLDSLLPGIPRQGLVKQVIIVDNGSTDTTHALADDFITVLRSPEPLSFAAAVNLGIRASRTTHTCLLNNDMVLTPGFFEALLEAFSRTPDLFCATAQILFPPGKRREETGKAVYHPAGPRDFPLRCDLPIDGETDSPVLYGSGGCSLYDTRKLLTIGGFNESFRPAYVEDLDTGWRGWQQGWPTVFVAAARLIHHHRSTTTRYFSPDDIQRAVETNYLRWILSSVATPHVFHDLWSRAITRINLLAAAHVPPPVLLDVLAFASFDKPTTPHDFPAQPRFPESEILALGSGNLACFPGAVTPTPAKPVILIATCYLPFPLSHGGAVRMYNLMREAAKDFTLVLASFVDEFQPPAPELTALCAEIFEVRREGSHYRRSSPNPKVVDDFTHPTFEATLRWAQRKYSPQLVQLEFTQMATYALTARPAKTILVEHDLTLDLYTQLLRDKDDFDLRLELDKWIPFERNAWLTVDCTVVMSEKDKATVTPANQVAVIENGVDIDRFTPSATTPTPRRLLFIGSLAHLPNLMALSWFLNEVWPLLSGYTLHIIAGRNPDYYLDFYKDRVTVDLAQPGIELEGFVSDVRPAYAQASIVIAPLLASAGTNIKIMEAMACGKAIVATPGGVNGLTLTPGEDFLLAPTAMEFAAAIERLNSDPTLRTTLEQTARRTAVSRYSWASIGEQQKQLYLSLLGRK